MKAAEALKRVESQFQEFSPETTDSHIKNTITNGKSLNKRSGHEFSQQSASQSVVAAN